MDNTMTSPHTRRDVLKLGLALSALGALAACGPSSSPPAPALATPGGATPSSSPNLAASPKPSASAPPSAAASAAARAASSPATAAVPATTASCTLTPEQEVGPFYVAGQQIRKDVTSGKPGVPLQLRLTVMDAASCKPLPNAAVDIWHADATGNYSSGSGSQLFLRGIQISDSSGIVEFATIYPGWYQGRAVHIHTRVRLGGTAGQTYDGGHISHTGQLFFPEDVSDQVYKLAPYSSHTGARVLNSRDGIFTGQRGSASIVMLTPLKPGSIADGFQAAMGLGVNAA
jgi:protocatechuate 3,4-dioxygenase beta subunit